MDSTTPSDRTKSSQGRVPSLPALFHTALSLPVCLRLPLPLSNAYVWVAIHQGHWISASDICCIFMTSWKLKRFFFFFLIQQPSKISASFILQRLRARRHSDTSCRLLGPVTSLPGGAGGRVHREEQASDADLPLHSSHADLLQVQRRVGSPGWPLDWTDCWPSHRYKQTVSHQGFVD